jgi:hypothetical protein
VASDWASPWRNWPNGRRILNGLTRRRRSIGCDQTLAGMITKHTNLTIIKLTILGKNLPHKHHWSIEADSRIKDLPGTHRCSVEVVPCTHRWSLAADSIEVAPTEEKKWNVCDQHVTRNIVRTFPTIIIKLMKTLICF